MIIRQRTKPCGSCTSIETRLSEVDCVIFEMSKKLHNNIVFGLNECIDQQEYISLFHFKRILETRLETILRGIDPDWLLEAGGDYILEAIGNKLIG